MHAVAEVLAAIVVGLAAAAFSWFGLALESREPVAERSVRRIPAAAPASTMVIPQSKSETPIPC